MKTMMLKKQKLNFDGEHSKTMVDDVQEEEEEDVWTVEKWCREEEDDGEEKEWTEEEIAKAKERDDLLAAEYEKRFGHIREMNDAEWAEYHRMVKQSQGFDVPYFPDTAEPGRIDQIRNFDQNDEVLVSSCTKALEKYNLDDCSNYQLERIVKANWQVVSGFMYYITFEATVGADRCPASACGDAQVVPETFQARVWLQIGNHKEVEMCRKITK